MVCDMLGLGSPVHRRGEMLGLLCVEQSDDADRTPIITSALTRCEEFSQGSVQAPKGLPTAEPV